MRRQIFAGIILSLAEPSLASTLLYDENISGDTPQLSNSGPSLLLSDGDNIIRGHWSWPATGNEAGIDDMDSFTLIIPAGLHLLGVDAEIANEDLGGSTEAGHQFTLIRNGYSFVADDYLGTVGLWLTPDPNVYWDTQASQLPPPWAFPFGSGTYWFGSTGGFKGYMTGSSPGSPSLDYSWIFHVSAVPVPSALWLLGSALGALGWVRRRAAA